MPVLVAIAAAAFMSTVVMRMTDPLVDVLAREFAVAPTQIAVFASAYALPYALFQLIFGPLGDRFGKTRVIGFAVSALAVTIVASALAPDYPAMIVIRFLSGMVGGGIIPLGLASVGDRYGLAERQVVLSRFMMATVSGQITGSFLTGILAEFVPWRGVFLGYGALAAAVAVVILRKAAREPVQGRKSGLGEIVARYVGIVTGRTGRVLLPIVFVEGAIFFAMASFLPPYLAEMRGFSSGQIGAVIAAYGLGGILFGLVVRPVLKLLGAYLMIVSGGLLGGAAVAGMTLALPLAGYALLAGVLGFSFTIMHNNFQTRATEMAPEARGSSVAVFACLLFFGNGTGPLFMKAGIVRAGYGPVFLATAALLVVFGLTAAAVLRARERT